MAITDADDTATDIHGDVVLLTAGSTIGAADNALSLAAGSLTTDSSSDNGSQHLLEVDSIDITHVDAGNSALSVYGGTWYLGIGDRIAIGSTLDIQTGATVDVNGANGDIFASIVVSGGTLLGEGILDANLSMNSGLTTPGNSPGVINVNDLTFSGGTYSVELGSTTAGSGAGYHDQLNVSGSVDLGAGTTLDVTVLTATYLPDLNDRFVIIDNDGTDDAVSGIFVGLSEGTDFIASGIALSISYVGGDGNDVELTAGDQDKVYVDDNWAGTDRGTDPDGTSPARSFGFDSFATIQAGIDAVAAGGEVFVYDHAGTGYPEALRIGAATWSDKGLRSHRALTKAMSLIAAADNHPVIDGTGLWGTGLKIIDSSSDITVNGFEIYGSFESGIYSYGTLAVVDSKVEGGFDGIVVDGGTATIADTLIQDAKIFGVEIINVGAAVISTSEITGNVGVGVMVAEGSVVITRTRLTANEHGMVVTNDGVATVYNSDLAGNVAKALENASATDKVNASANWWGSRNEADVNAVTSGLIDFTPYFSSGIDTDDGARGFAGDFSLLHVTALGEQVPIANPDSDGRIQEGVDRSLASGTVYIEPGTYAESVTVPVKNLTLTGRSGTAADVMITPPASDSGLTITGSAVTASNLSVTGGAVGIDVDGSTATVQNTVLNGNTIGLQSSNDGLFDASENDLTGYMGEATANSGAIVNQNTDIVSGPQGTPPDVKAHDNQFHASLTNPLEVEMVIWHDRDDNGQGFVDYADLSINYVIYELASIVEAEAVTVTGSFFNDPQAHTVRIDWGDQSSATVIRS